MSDRSSPSVNSQERSPWSRASVLISGAFLLALILAGVMVAALGDPDRHPAPTPRRTLSGPDSAAGAPSASRLSTGCSLPAGNQTVPTAAPPSVTEWGDVGSMQVPQAPSTLGPQRTIGVWNTCFAHSPSGALLAALNLWAEGTAADPGTVFAHLAVGAPAELGNGERLDAGGPVQFAGYRYQSYDSTTARVLVVLRGPQGKLGAAATTMRWVGGDWKYVFPAGGGLSIEVVQDLTGYVPWSSF
jgi:hypothetical protein